MNLRLPTNSFSFYCLNGSDVLDSDIDSVVDHIVTAGGPLYLFMHECLGSVFNDILKNHIKNSNSLYSKIYLIKDVDLVLGSICAMPAKDFNYHSKNLFIDILKKCPVSFRNDLILLSRRYSTYIPNEMHLDSCVYLSRIAVSNSLHGSGISSLLFNYFENLNSSTTICLHVDKANIRAKQFYNKNGFNFFIDGKSDMHFAYRNPF